MTDPGVPPTDPPGLTRGTKYFIGPDDPGTTFHR